jgi:hypothetical protein
MKKKKVLALQAQNVKLMNKIIKKLPSFMKMIINSETCGCGERVLPKDEWAEGINHLFNHLQIVDGGGNTCGQYQLPSALEGERNPQYLNFVRFRGEDGSVDFQNNSTDGTNVLSVIAVVMNEVRIAKEAEKDPEKVPHYIEVLHALQHAFDGVGCL